ncbi:beta-1,3-galactosyltransferase 1-like [Branchiostoma floridae]|uniref:Hexosyltransferase n=1 Tax=Branchiostoma floridae TaxID=7739 RepID=A0A9J7L671_BRAFL|nr:beta-1,3-galactosyltransferase 1-like [Branchiostoma floridae]
MLAPGFRASSRIFTWFLMASLLGIISLIVLVVWVIGYHGNPYSETANQKYSSEVVKKPINPHPYRFTMAHEDKCERDGNDVFLVIIVHTAHDHVTQRQAIRATWANESNTPGVEIKTLFALGTTDQQDLQREVEKEDAIFGDIIQENFLDSYKNLTLKAVMTLKWFLDFCPNAAYLMKIDDDTYVNLDNLIATLLGMEQKSQLVLGNIHTKDKPIRKVENKWYLSRYSFLRESLPSFASGGSGYVISGDIVRSLYETSLRTKYIYLEDVFIGMCLETLGITPVHNGGFLCCQRVDIDDRYPCAYQHHITVHGLSALGMSVLSRAERECVL